VWCGFAGSGARACGAAGAGATPNRPKNQTTCVAYMSGKIGKALGIKLWLTGRHVTTRQENATPIKEEPLRVNIF